MCVIYIYNYIYTLGYQTTPRSSHPQVWVPYFFPYSFPYLFLRDSARLRLLNGQLEDYLNYLGLCVVLIQSLIWKWCFSYLKTSSCLIWPTVLPSWGRWKNKRSIIWQTAYSLIWLTVLPLWGRWKNKRSIRSIIWKTAYSLIWLTVLPSWGRWKNKRSIRSIIWKTAYSLIWLTVLPSWGRWKNKRNIICPSSPTPEGELVDWRV